MVAVLGTVPHLAQGGVNEKRKVFMRVDERLFYIF